MSIKTISQKLREHGITPDSSRIESEYNRLTKEFGVPIKEAVRTILDREYKDNNITPVKKEYIAPPPRDNPSDNNAPELCNIDSLKKDEWVSLKVKVVSTRNTPSSAVSQMGIITDQTAAIKYVIFSKSNIPPLEQGAWYTIESAVVDEYNGVLNLKIHAGSTVTKIDCSDPVSPLISPIEHVAPGITSIQGKVTQIWEPFSDKIAQTGIIADTTGSIKFTTWANSETMVLEKDKVYTIYFASADLYKDKLSVNISNCAIVENDDITIDIKSTEQTITGAFVQVSSGSGLIKRCPVEGCKRPLTRQNFCQIHEMQPNYIYDLRLRAVLDDGITAHSVLIQRQIFEKLIGMTLDEAIEIAESQPLGMSEIEYRITPQILGKYITVSGKPFEDLFIVNSAEWSTLDTAKLTTLINETGESA